MTSGHDVSECVGTLGLVKSYFFNIFEKKIKKIEKKKYLGAPTPPEDEAICLFAGLLANPDMVLSRLIRQKLWSGFLGQTSVYRSGKHQNDSLCITVDSPATVRPL